MTNEPLSPLERILAGLTAGDILLRAELYARGERCLRIVHGAPESEDDMRRIENTRVLVEEIVAELGADGQLVRTVGTDDTTTYWFTSTERVHADRIVDALGRRVRGIAAPWWRVDHEPT